MPITVLVAYATRSGSTAEVAKAIGAALRDAGITQQELPMRQLESLQGPGAVILGAPLYIGRFPREFHQFMVRHHHVFAAIHPWCFVLGPARVEAADFEMARKQAEKQLARYRWLHPAELQIFGGKYDVKNLPYPYSLVLRIPFFPVNKIPPSDIRDWAAIKEWGLGIARQVKHAA